MRGDVCLCVSELQCLPPTRLDSHYVVGHIKCKECDLGDQIILEYFLHVHDEKSL